MFNLYLQRKVTQLSSSCWAWTVDANWASTYMNGNKPIPMLKYSLVVRQSVKVRAVLYACCCSSQNGIFHFRFRLPSLASIELNSLCLSFSIPVLRPDAKSLLFLQRLLHLSNSIEHSMQFTNPSQVPRHRWLSVWHSQRILSARGFSIMDPKRITMSSTGTECIWNVKAEVWEKRQYAII